MSCTYLAIVTSILNAVLIKASQKGRAPFLASNTGIEGYVDLVLGHMWIDLDFTELVSNPVFFNQLPRNDCFVEGLQYSINTAWSYSEEPIIDRIGENACHPNYTDYHLDTWLACSPDSGNQDCIQYEDGCIEASTSWSKDDVYVCNNDTLRLVPYSCELGDLSGKYGKLNISFDLYYEHFNETDWKQLYEDIYNASDFDDASVFNDTDFEFASFEEWKLFVYSPNLHMQRHDNSFWEIDYIAITPPKSAKYIADHSLVISCGNGDHERIACSGFIQTGNSYVDNPLTGDQVITISFKGNDYDQEFNEFYREIDLTDPEYEDWQCIDYDEYHFGNETYNDTDDYPCIWQLFQLEISETGYSWKVPDEIKQLCNEFWVWIYEGWDSGDINATINEECDYELMGDIWDPTHSCINGSNSEYCDDGTRCNNTFVDYATLCREANADLFFCAVGDVSSRMGSLNIELSGTQDVDTGIWTVNAQDDLSAPLYALSQKSIRLQCIDTNAQIFWNTGVYGNDTFQLEDICAVTIQTEGTVVTGSPLVPATGSPSVDPTPTPTVEPTVDPTVEPTVDPTVEPTNDPSVDPTIDPTADPTKQPSLYPTQESESSEDDFTAKLGTGGMVGFIVGIIVGLVLICGCIWFFAVYKPRKAKLNDGSANKASIEVHAMDKMKSMSGEEAEETTELNK